LKSERRSFRDQQAILISDRAISFHFSPHLETSSSISFEPLSADFRLFNAQNAFRPQHHHSDIHHRQLDSTTTSKNGIKAISAYSTQEMRLGHKIIIMTFNAGCSIGSTIRRIAKGENEVLYTDSMLVATDHLLDGYQTSAQWHPALWIIEAGACKESGLMIRQK
jgi:hypothetical protein